MWLKNSVVWRPGPGSGSHTSTRLTRSIILADPRVLEQITDIGE